MSKKEEVNGQRSSSRYADRRQRSGTSKDDGSVVSYLQKMKFKKKIIGGVDEADVWRKVKGLSDRYEALLRLVQSQNGGRTAPGTDAPLSLAGQAVRGQRRRIADKREIASFFGRLIGLSAFVWVMLFVIFGLTSMPNNDMSPRISAGDLLFYYRLDKSYSSNDVIVYEKDGTTYVGRVVARPGDSVEISTEDGLYVNGSIVMETDIYYQTRAYDNDITYPITLDDDEVFVLGDYRDGAKDSRVVGAVRKSEIKGKVISVLRRSSL